MTIDYSARNLKEGTDLRNDTGNDGDIGFVIKSCSFHFLLLLQNQHRMASSSSYIAPFFTFHVFNNDQFLFSHCTITSFCSWLSHALYFHCFLSLILSLFDIVLSLLHFHFLYSATSGLPRLAPDDLPITQIDLFSSF